jgi:3'-phosphoadenosine 5'-phosphosulfate sulfotransferase (PAPS reductase)/FAD synthetase
MTRIRHILSLSGGKDSAALAVYMRDRVPEMEYVFHDTDMELPETYAYLARLEAVLGRPIERTKAALGFDHWHRAYGYMLPSQQRRWCTKMLKLKPFEALCGDTDTIYNYIGLRADERRSGYISTKPNIHSVFPFREDGRVKADIFRILEESGVGLPRYTDWGRTRSGCFFCFFQQKIEWVRLLEHYPELFERAKEYEAMSVVNGEPFFWSAAESLEQLSQPKRVAEIKALAERKALAPKARRNLPLMEVFDNVDSTPDNDDACVVCHV